MSGDGRASNAEGPPRTPPDDVCADVPDQTVRGLGTGAQIPHARTSGGYGLEYACDELTAALRFLASSERPRRERLQTVWTDHVQMLWMKPCLTAELLTEFP